MFNMENQNDILNYASKLFDKGDYSGALKCYNQLAENGEPAIHYLIGRCYMSLGNIDEAVIWYKKAAELGNASAQEILGDLYFSGEYMEEDVFEAVKWIRKAAENGMPSSQNTLGMLYYVGNGVELDYEQAFRWLQSALNNGIDDDYLRLILGECYLLGRGTIRDYRIALDLFQKLSVSEDCAVVSSAKNNLGIMYCKGYGVQKNLDKATQLFQEAITETEYDELVPIIKTNLGGLYYDARNFSKAKDCFLESISSGLNDMVYPSMFGYGKMLWNGDGVCEDRAEAIKLFAECEPYYRVTAEAGDAESQYVMGILMWYCQIYNDAENLIEELKEGREAYIEARKWWQKAAEKGHEEAKEELKKTSVGGILLDLLKDATKEAVNSAAESFIETSLKDYNKTTNN